MADAHDAELRSELGNYWTAPPQTPKRKQRAARMTLATAGLAIIRQRIRRAVMSSSILYWCG